MNREFFLNALFLLFANVLIKPFYVFGIERSIQDTVGAEQYGLYATLFSFTFLLFIVNDFGIHYFNNRTIAQHPQLLSKYFPNILVLKTLLTCVYLLLVFAAALLRGFEVEIFHLLFFIAINHILISMVAYLRSNISGLGMYRTDSVISTLDKVLLIVLCALLLWGGVFEGPFQIEWFVHAQNAAWLLTALTAFFIVKKKLGHRLRLRLDLPFLLVIVKKSAPFALAIFLMTVYIRIDVVILEWMLPNGRAEVGAYAAAYRLLDAFNMVGVLFAGLLLPMFATLLRPSAGTNLPESPEPARQLQDGVSSLLRFSVQMIWAGTLPLAVACYFFRKELMLWLYPATATPYYGEVAGFVILTLVPFTANFIYGSLLTANNSLRKMNGLFFGAIVLNVGLNLLVIPAWKAAGVGAVAFATQSFVLAGQVWFVKKELGIGTPGRQVLKMSAFSVLTVLLAWQLYHLPGGMWLVKFGAAVAGGLLLSVFFRLIHFRTLRGFIRRA